MSWRLCGDPTDDRRNLAPAFSLEASGFALVGKTQPRGPHFSKIP